MKNWVKKVNIDKMKINEQTRAEGPVCYVSAIWSLNLGYCLRGTKKQPREILVSTRADTNRHKQINTRTRTHYDKLHESKSTRTMEQNNGHMTYLIKKLRSANWTM